MANKRYDELDPEHHELIHQLYKSGQFTQRRLANELNDRGIPTPNGRKWTLDAVQRALKIRPKPRSKPAFEFPDLGLDRDAERFVKREILRAEKDAFAEANRLTAAAREEQGPYHQAETMTADAALNVSLGAVEPLIPFASPHGMGAQKRKYRRQLLQGTGLDDLPDDAVFAPFKEAAEIWMTQQVEILRRQYELLGPGVMAAVGSAASSYALHRFYNNAVIRDPMGKIGLATLAARFGHDINAHIKAARDLAKQENEALKRDEPRDAFKDLIDAANDDG